MKRRAFTLLEVITVVIIIVIMLGLAVPAFKYITGSRSVDAAQNILAAALGRARTEAVYRGKPVGLCIFRDPAQDRYGMVMVTHPDFSPYDASTQYADAQTAGFDRMESFVTNAGNGYVCATPTGAGTAPPSSGWMQVSAWTLTMLPGAGVSYLQPGIGAQGMNSSPTLPAGNLPDRLLGVAVIMFDAQGKVATGDRYTIDFNGTAGTKLGDMLLKSQPVYGSGAVQTFGTNPPMLVGQIGLILYDREAFKSSGYDAERDAGMYGQSMTTAWTNPVAGTEKNEEAWIMSNGLSLLVNRYTGALIRGE